MFVHSHVYCCWRGNHYRTTWLNSRHSLTYLFTITLKVNHHLCEVTWSAKDSLQKSQYNAISLLYQYTDIQQYVPLIAQFVLVVTHNRLWVSKAWALLRIWQVEDNGLGGLTETGDIVYYIFEIMTGGHVTELTLAILKPDLVARARDLQVSER